MKSVIVTGADGFVGSYLVDELLKSGYIVYAIGLKEKPVRLDLSNPNLVYLDISRKNIYEYLDFFKNKEIVYFYHFAWQGSAGDERKDEMVQIQNIIMTTQYLRFASSIGCKRFISSGTIMEFETYHVTYDQGSKPALNYIYGAGKGAAHQMCKPIANSIGIDLLWVYISNAYGPGETAPRLVNTTIQSIIEKKPLKFTSGEQIYDFVYVSDVAKAFRLVGERGIKNKNYMIGSGNPKPLKDFLLQLIDAIDHNAIYSFGDLKYTGIELSRETFSISELEKDCGYVADVGFSEGIINTYNYLKGMLDATI